MLEHHCSAKIGDFHDSTQSDEQVLRFDVAVDYTMLV